MILLSAILLIVLGIIATYLGAANLYRYFWWDSNYEGEYTQGEDSMWSKGNVAGYMIFGVFFTVTGVLGILAGFILFFWGQSAVIQDNKPFLRKVLLPIAILAMIPSPGLIFVGFMLLFTWMMYNNERYDFFGLLLEDVTRTRRRAPMAAEPAAAGYGGEVSRDMYATGYQEQQGLYSDDYAQAAYGGGEGAYTGAGSLLDAEVEETPVEEPTPEETPATAPACSSCGKPTEWIEEYGRYYCYDCDTYV
jgi:hypothetical protein